MFTPLISQPQVNEFIHRYSLGESLATIAKLYGYTPNTIKNHLNNQGIKCRTLSLSHKKYLCGTPNIINAFSEFVRSTLNINTNVHPYIINNTHSTISYNGFSAIKIMSSLYKHATTYLDRKHTKYISVVDNLVLRSTTPNKNMKKIHDTLNYCEIL